MMKHKLFACLILVLCVGYSSAQDSIDFNSHFRLLPQPQKIHLLPGAGLSFADIKGIVLVNTVKTPVMGSMMSTLPISDDTLTGNLFLIINKDLGELNPEGYSLEITGKQIRIEATANAGLFYGAQTLEQLLEDARDQDIQIPNCKISDAPKIGWRAIHLDLKHHVDAGHYYYHIIDQLASIKINAIIIEFEDKLRYRGSPLVAAPDAISIEEFAAISRYAKARNIEISPLVQGLGHASFILKHPAYKKLRDDPASDWVFDPLNPATYKLQFSLYEDAIAATPYGKYLHVGGDEVGALGKSALSKKSGKKPIELQLYWLKKVTDFAKAHHRIPIFWDDMVFKLAGLYETTYDSTVGEKNTLEAWKKNRPLLDSETGLFPTECIYMRWNYDDAGLWGNRMAIDWYQSKGLPVMAATAAQQVWPMIPQQHSNFEAIKGYCKLTSEKRMAGILCTSWDDCSPHLETVWRGFYDFAALSWNFQDVDVATAHKIFRHRFYGPAAAGEKYDFQDSLEAAMPFWETALIEKGDRFNYPKLISLVDLPVKENPGSWSHKYQAKLDAAANAMQQYEQINERIKNTRAHANRNQYALSIMEQVNELQVYSARIILLLGQYDHAASNTKAMVLAQLKSYVADFPKLRSAFEAVYAKTRVMGNPAGYIPDSNFHAHLANGTNNTDWMFVYELAMNKKILAW